MAKKEAKEWQNRITGYGEESPDQLLANPRNHRIHPKRQQDALSGSLDTLGYIQTVIVNKNTGHIVDGHLRVTMALREGQTSIPVTYVELTEAEEAQALLSLDPIAAMAANDKDKVDELLRMVNTDNEQVMKHLADFAAENKLDYGQPEKVDAPAEIDRAAELAEKWATASGQLWRLGDHRLLIGDCTVRENVERLMGGERADMVFEDPPYNVAGEGRNYAADAPTQKKTYETLKNSEWDKDFDIKPHLALLLDFMGDNCAVYICTSQWLVQIIWEWMWSWSKFCSYCVWCKPNPAPSLAKRHWNFSTELIPYAVRGKHIANYPAQGHALSWWQIVSPSHTEPHPTQKPIEIPSRAIEFSSNVGDLVVDFFGGSGTTMVACNNLGRKCRMIEIDPKYGAVILQRMSDFGVTPILAE